MAVAGALLACGKKGAPLAPIVHVPAAAADFTARRVGDTVHLQLTVPSANTDGTRPADVGSVTIYGFTGSPQSNDDFTKRGTVVAQFPVRRPPPPLPEGANPDVPPLPPSGPGLDQGAVAVALEELTPEVRQPILPKAPRRREPPPPEPSDTVLAMPLAGPRPDVMVSRVYAAIGSNRHGQKGPFSPRISVPLTGAPSPPAAPEVTYTAAAIIVRWTAPPDARRHLQIPTALPPPAPATPSGTFATVMPPAAPPTPSAAAPAAPPAPTAVAPAAPTPAPAPAAPAVPADPGAPLPSRPLSLASSASSYNVYEVPPPEPKEPSQAAPATSAQAGQPTVPPLVKPLNPAPVAAPPFEDPRLEFGTERCYVVRTVNTYGTMVTESAPSAPTCVTLVDTFPPAAPKSLAAVASPGAISLIWEANAEPDLSGYVVLRAEAPNETLQPLFETPIRETSYQDKTVTAGVRYTYAVIALDKAAPPNPSPQSNRVTETGR